MSSVALVQVMTLEARVVMMTTSAMVMVKAEMNVVALVTAVAGALVVLVMGSVWRVGQVKGLD